MATKFSPCKGSYVLNQFPSNVMFGMNGFHLSASGAIQGHHGPLVTVVYAQEVIKKTSISAWNSSVLSRQFVMKSSTILVTWTSAIY